MSCRSGYNKNCNNKTQTALTRKQRELLLDCFADDYSDMVALARRIGVSAFDAVLESFGGAKVHVPTPATFWQRLQRECRDETLRRKFNGVNHQELADEAGLTLRQVYRIVHHRNH